METITVKNLNYRIITCNIFWAASLVGSYIQLGVKIENRRNNQ